MYNQTIQMSLICSKNKIYGSVAKVLQKIGASYLSYVRHQNQNDFLLDLGNFDMVHAREEKKR